MRGEAANWSASHTLGSTLLEKALHDLPRERGGGIRDSAFSKEPCVGTFGFSFIVAGLSSGKNGPYNGEKFGSTESLARTVAISSLPSHRSHDTDVSMSQQADSCIFLHSVCWRQLLILVQSIDDSVGPQL